MHLEGLKPTWRPQRSDDRQPELGQVEGILMNLLNVWDLPSQGLA